MRGGALPPALLLAALGLALAFAPRRTIAPAVVTALLVALAVSFFSVAHKWDDAVFLGCWISVAITAAAVHAPDALRSRLALPLSLNAGVWSGAVVAAAGSQLDLLVASPAALLCVPGFWLVSRGRGIVIKVAASWLIAIGVLSLSLQLAPATPGYKPDHMD